MAESDLIELQGKIPNPADWVSSLIDSGQLDVAVAEGLDVMSLARDRMANGTTTDQEIRKALVTDRGVWAKNQVLIVMSDMFGKAYHVSDLIGLLERQALEPEMTPAEETRYRQFMGIWDLIWKLTQHPEIIDAIRAQPDPDLAND